MVSVVCSADDVLEVYPGHIANRVLHGEIRSCNKRRKKMW